MANPAENNVKNESPAQENKMGVMPVGKLLFTMSLPIMISMLVQALYNVVDSMFVARVSENALTALSMAFPIQNLMIAVSTGLGVGLNAVLSRALGAKDEKGVNRAATNGIMLLFICGLVFMLGGATIVRPYFEMQTDIAEIVESGVDYTTIVMLGSMGIFMQILFERLLQSTGRTLLTMVSQGVGAIANIILDPIFIFGLFGVPKMGVAGAAYATILGQWIAAAIGLVMNIRKNPEVSISMKGFRPHGATIRRILSIGIPSVVMQSIGSVMTFLMNQILIAFSATAVAVFGVYFKLQSFFFMPLFGLNNATISIIAYNYGARKPQRITKTLKISCTAALCLMTVQRAEQQPHRVEAVKLAVVHHVVGAALGAGIGLIRHLQRIERTGDILPQPEHAPVEVFPAGPRREHGVAVFPGGAVQGGQVLIKGEGDMGILCPGQCVHQIRNQRSRTGQKDIKRFHRCTGSPPKFQTVDVLILRRFYSIT